MIIKCKMNIGTFNCLMYISETIFHLYVDNFRLVFNGCYTIERKLLVFMLN